MQNHTVKPEFLTESATDSMEMEKTAEATKESGDSSTLASCKSGDDSDDDSTSMDMDTCADEVADFADYCGTNQEEEGLHAEEVA